jgi:hypothetical protein
VLNKLEGNYISAYAPFETEYNDQECLVAALAENGYPEVEVHENAQPLIGYHGDTRVEVANIIVRRKNIGSSSNDIGFVKGTDGKYKAIISDFDRGKHNAKWLVGLKVAYTDKRMAKEAKRQGLKLKSRAVVNGKLVVRYLQA